MMHICGTRGRQVNWHFIMLFVYSIGSAAGLPCQSLWPPITPPPTASLTNCLQSQITIPVWGVQWVVWFPWRPVTVMLWKTMGGGGGDHFKGGAGWGTMVNDVVWSTSNIIMSYDYHNVIWSTSFCHLTNIIWNHWLAKGPWIKHG